MMHNSCPCQNQSENSKKPRLHIQLFTYVNFYENIIFLFYRKGNGHNYPKSLFLNAFMNIEISFLQVGSKYSIFLIKSGIFHSSNSNRAIVFTGAKGFNRITLIIFVSGLMNNFEKSSGFYICTSFAPLLADLFLYLHRKKRFDYSTLKLIPQDLYYNL